MSSRPATDEHVEKCLHCGEPLATVIGGVIIFGGQPIVAVAGECKKCHSPFSLPRECGGIVINPEGVERIFRSLHLVQENDGTGKLVIMFRNHRLIRVGVADLEWQIGS